MSQTCDVGCYVEWKEYHPLMLDVVNINFNVANVEL
jgi:hypothetical protein